MQIDIKHIAKLSRLKLPDDQIETFQKQMQDIVEMVEKLPETDGSLAIDPENRMELRRDEIMPSLRRDILLKNAPEVAAGCV
ncbi:MAG: Asp-tRNA(Asn)/Glu-tRNA(Gln) amidotransferase subunit GatC, partial [Angelakisella sp.]